VFAAEPLDRIEVHLEAVAGLQFGKTREVALRPNRRDQLRELAEVALEARRRYHLEDASSCLAGVPECVPDAARLCDELPGTRAEDLVADLEADLARDLAAIDEEWEAKAAATETVEVPLEKSDVRIVSRSLVWIPVG
jgi:hypothetical protein